MKYPSVVNKGIAAGILLGLGAAGLSIFVIKILTFVTPTTENPNAWIMWGILGTISITFSFIFVHKLERELKKEIKQS